MKQGYTFFLNYTYLHVVVRLAVDANITQYIVSRIKWPTPYNQNHQGEDKDGPKISLEPRDSW